MSEQGEFQIENVATIDLLRHGECEGGAVYRGSTDLPLNDNGWQQMCAALPHPQREFPWRHIVSSPLQRCQAFAQELSGRHGCSLEVIDDFREVHFGDWEGRAIAEVWEQERNHVKTFFADPENKTPPNGEPMIEFRERVERGWQQILEQASGKQILLVTHGGVIRVLLASLLNIPLANIGRFEVPYASLNRIKVFYSEGKPWPVLQFLNGSL